MRNLKKILALVLALVMSLSLMATASAKQDFTDASSIDEKYATAVEVLNGLEVFKGYQNGSSYDFQPNGEITRAEVAAIIYRIATGDVKDEQVKIYADYNKFTDVPNTLWSAGYINYCANAEYIKGEGNGKFNPEGKVTGYQALAMILRAIGYTANGGFTGPGWDLQTAAVGEARGITKNILKGTLNENASRQTVAEILFQSILVNMVNFDQRTGYYELDESLGYKIFKLEELEGVVVANEYANLYGDNVLANGKTNLEVAKDDIRTLDLETKITDIGERRALYTQNTKKVLLFTGDGLNTVKETGAATDISTAAKFQSVAGMPKASDIEFYRNFNRVGQYTCDQRLEFNVAFYGIPADYRFEEYGNMVQLAANDSEWVVERGTFTGNNDATGWTRVVPDTNGNYTIDYDGAAYRFTKIIPATKVISADDMSVIEGIFAIADNVNNNVESKYRITGDVYVGTKSTPTADERDLSNNISFNTFLNEYVNEVTYDVSWKNSGNGVWVKFIDNDNDGKCDYAFRTTYSLDEVIGSYKNKAGDTVMDYNGFNDDASIEANLPVRYMDGVDTVERNVAVGDVVLAAIIDGQILVSHADSVTSKASNYDWKTEEITTADGKYGQSYIGNNTDMLHWLSNMAAQTTYEMFFDKFGYVRAYRIPGDTQYALLTELYYNNNANGSIIKNWPMTAELTMPDENGNPVTKEYSTSSSNPFVAKFAWTFSANRTQLSSLQNWLQPVVANLGVNRVGYGPVIYSPLPSNVSASYTGTYWPGWLQQTRTISSLVNANGLTSTEFNYGPQNYYDNAGNATVATPVAGSFTNIAIVNIDGESATLKGAAELNLKRDAQLLPASNPNAYAVNYIQLSTKDIVKGASSYTIGGDPAYQKANNYTVSANNDTEIYVVHNGGVEYFKGYANMPKLTEKENIIHAAYAVAKNTNLDNDGVPYWVADVIVYEVKKWDDLEKTSISLAYFTANQTLQSANGTIINTLNSKTDPAKVDLRFGIGWNDSGNWDSIANNDWLNSWKSYGFYQLWNSTDAVDGVMTAAKIDKIDSKFNDSKIFAGVVAREVDLATNGGYVPVNMTGAKEADGVTLKIEASVKVTETSVYSVTNNQSGPVWYTEADNLYYSNIRSSQVKAGDQVVWVGAGEKTTAVNSASFIVDLGNPIWSDNPLHENYELSRKTPNWLKTIYGNIMNEQGKAPAPEGTRKLTIKAAGLPFEWSQEINVSIGSTLQYNFTGRTLFNGSLVIPTGYNLSSVSPAIGDEVLGVTVSGTTNADYTIVGVVASADGQHDTITLNYAAPKTDLTVTLDNDGVASWTGTDIRYNVPSITPAYGDVLNGTVISAIPYDGDVTLTWVGAANTTYSVTAGTGYKLTQPAEGTNTWTVTGKVDGTNGALTIKASAVVYDVTVGENIEFKDALSNPITTTNWSTNLTGTITAAAGYTLPSTAVVKVIDTNANVEIPSTYNSATGELTITKSAGTGRDVTITATGLTKNQLTVTIKNTNNIGGAWSLTSADDTFTGKALVDNSTISMEVGQTLYVRTDNNKVPTIGALVPDTVTNSNNQMVYVFNGINASVDMTINP